MRRLDLSRRDAGTRARRGDAIVLGGALPGLVAAIRLGQRGHRVLVVEEGAAAGLPAHPRYHFFPGAPAAASPTSSPTRWCSPTRVWTWATPRRPRGSSWPGASTSPRPRGSSWAR